MSIEQELRNNLFNYANRNYWFIRTASGFFYEEFINEGYVAIDNDNVRYSEILDAFNNETKNKSAQKIIGQLIKKRNPKSTSHFVHAKALIDFIYNIKKDDIVFIPDESERLQFGYIDDTSLHLETTPKGDCPFSFRRKVKWFESKRRRQLDAEVWPLFNTQKTLNNANKYSDFINPALNSLYLLNDRTHLVLDVTTTKPINGRTLFSLGNDILDLSSEINEYLGKDPNDEIDVKIELGSPGSIELITESMLPLLYIGVIIVGVAGGSLKFKLNKWQFEFNTQGLIDRISKFLNEKVERKNKVKDVKQKSKELGITDKKGDIRDFLKEK
jgi:hypothetical protein